MQSQSLPTIGTIRFVPALITDTKLLLKRGTGWNKLGGGVTKMLDHYISVFDKTNSNNLEYVTFALEDIQTNEQSKNLKGYSCNYIAQIEPIVIRGYGQNVSVFVEYGSNNFTDSIIGLGRQKSVRQSIDYDFEYQQDGSGNSGESRQDYVEVAPGKLGFTDERIDELLSDGWYGSMNKDYAQAYIAYMSPMDFLKFTTGKNQALRGWRVCWRDR